VITIYDLHLILYRHETSSFALNKECT